MPQSNTPSLILLVDDDPKAARILVQMLREDGFVVELAIGDDAATERLARRPAPAILLLALRTPYVEGTAVVGSWGERGQGRPSVVVTSYPERMGLLQRVLTPPPTILPKPLAYAELRAELERIAERAPPREVAAVELHAGCSR